MRHFYRCIDCLAVVATESKIEAVNIPGTWDYSLGECAACGGRIEYLGQVDRDHLARTELRVPCDARCTGAIGPHCECQCGGVNHGSNRVVEVVVETGKAPRVMVPPDAKEKAAAYRGLLRAVRSAHWEGQRFNGRILAARELRSHSARNKKLKAILSDMNGTPGAMGVMGVMGVCA